MVSAVELFEGETLSFAVDAHQVAKALARALRARPALPEDEADGTPPSPGSDYPSTVSSDGVFTKIFGARHAHEYSEYRRRHDHRTDADVVEHGLPQALKEENRHWRALVDDGGRPAFSMEHIEHVMSNWLEESDKYGFWGAVTDREEHGVLRKCEGRVIEPQHRRWQGFRKWQNNHRGLEGDDDGGYPAFLRAAKQDMMEDGYMLGLAEIHCNPLHLMEDWQKTKAMEQALREKTRESGCSTWPDYVDAAKRRLAQHQFDAALDLKEDPKQQDALTTWIEYLYFEYWSLDKFVEQMEQGRFKEAENWRKLHLEPQENKEVERILNLRTVGIQEGHDRIVDMLERASKLVKSEHDAHESELVRLFETIRYDSDNPEDCRKLREAYDAKEASRKHWEAIKDRPRVMGAYLRSFYLDEREYKSQQKQLPLLSAVSDWVRSQVPLVEAEMKQAGSDAEAESKQHHEADSAAEPAPDSAAAVVAAPSTQSRGETSGCKRRRASSPSQQRCKRRKSNEADSVEHAPAVPEAMPSRHTSPA